MEVTRRPATPTEIQRRSKSSSRVGSLKDGKKPAPKAQQESAAEMALFTEKLKKLQAKDKYKKADGTPMSWNEIQLQQTAAYQAAGGKEAYKLQKKVEKQKADKLKKYQKKEKYQKEGAPMSYDEVQAVKTAAYEAGGGKDAYQAKKKADKKQAEQLKKFQKKAKYQKDGAPMSWDEIQAVKTAAYAAGGGKEAYQAKKKADKKQADKLKKLQKKAKYQKDGAPMSYDEIQAVKTAAYEAGGGKEVYQSKKAGVKKLDAALKAEKKAEKAVEKAIEKTAKAEAKAATGDEKAAKAAKEAAKAQVKAEEAVAKAAEKQAEAKTAEAPAAAAPTPAAAS